MKTWPIIELHNKKDIEIKGQKVYNDIKVEQAVCNIHIFFQEIVSVQTLNRDRGATLRLGGEGGPLVIQYWGAKKHFFLLILYNFKNIGGHVPPCSPTPPTPPPPPPPTARSLLKKKKVKYYITHVVQVYWNFVRTLHTEAQISA